MNKLAALKKRLIKEAVIAAAVIAGLCFLLSVSVFLQFSVSDEHNKLTSEISSLNNQNRSIKQEYENFSNSSKRYETIDKTRKTTSELSSFASRIRVARPVIQDLKSRYNFQSLEVTFSPIEEEKGIYPAKTVKVLRDSVTINFETISDEAFFQFLQALLKEFPGYIEIKDIRIEKKQDLTPEVIKQLSEGKGKMGFVGGTVNFEWRSLAEISKDNDKK